MQLFVKNLAGQTVAVSVEAQQTLSTLTAQVPELANAQLFFGGKALSSEQTFADYFIQSGSTIDSVVPVEGGKGKKKKKRIFTKPKKNAHKHKNVPMRVLKFYKVEEGDDDSYKVTTERVVCPHPSCGAGVFMAVHKDRKTCGKCFLTYVAKK